MSDAPIVLRGLLLAIAAASCLACGSPGGACEAVCASGNACPGAQQVKCASYCATTVSINAATGCDASYADYLACKTEHERDACFAADESCVPSLAAWFECVERACQASPPPDGCS